MTYSNPYDAEEYLRLTKRTWTLQLYKEFSAICFHYRLKLDKPVIKIAVLTSRWGSWDPLTRTITIAHKLIETCSWDSTIEILKHEIAHMIVNEIFHEPDHTHGVHFHRACEILGISSWASASESDLMSNREPGQSFRTLSTDDEKLLKRVEKLLALASSSNEHEALLAMQRVRELYAKYNIKRLQEQQGFQPNEYNIVIVNHKKKIVPQHQSMIASILTRHFFVEVVFSSLYDQHKDCDHKTLEILGTNQNVKMAEYVYYFLWNNLESHWLSFQKKTGKPGKAKKSYFLGLLAGFDEKLAKRSEHTTPAGTTWALTLNQNRSLINAGDKHLAKWLSQRHPRLENRKWNSSMTDTGSYIEGHKDGQKLTLSRGITNKSPDKTKRIGPPKA